MKKKILLGLLLCACCLLTACGQFEKLGNETDVKIKWLLPAREDHILESEETLVEQELRKAFADQNIEVDLCFVNEEEYTSQVMKMLQTDENWDVMFLNLELNQVMRSETKKYFAPLTKLLAGEYSNFYAAMPEYVWDIMKVNKEIYAIPNKHCWAGQEGYYIRADYLNSYGKMFRDGKEASFADVESFLNKVTNAKNCVGTYIPDDQWAKELLSNNFYFTGDLETLGVVKRTRNGYVVENMFETEEFEAYCYRMRRWFLDGYIRRDSAVRDSNEAMIAQEREKGLFALEPADYLMPGVEKSVEVSYGNVYSFDPIPTSKTVIMPNKVAEYATAFNVDSEHLEEALTVAERIYEDQDLYNTILYGIENVHYEKINDRQIKKLPDSGYGSDYAGAIDSYVLGNQYLSYVLEEDSYDKWERMETWEAQAEVSGTMGFFFRTTLVSDEIRNVSAIIDSDLRLLETGSVDVDSFLPEFQEKLREAGADRIIDEYQKQLTRWLDNKNEK
mgnify:CR=1 FL=1